jgi:hypothetical protein
MFLKDYGTHIIFYAAKSGIFHSGKFFKSLLFLKGQCLTCAPSACRQFPWWDPREAGGQREPRRPPRRQDAAAAAREAAAKPAARRGGPAGEAARWEWARRRQRGEADPRPRGVEEVGEEFLPRGTGVRPLS